MSCYEKGKEQEKILRSKKLLGNDYDNFKNKRIAIIGAGGTGNFITQLISKYPLKEIIIFDGDKIEKSNLERQVIFSKEDIGKNKAKILAKKLDSLNNIKYEETFIDNKNIKELIKEEFDLIIDCTDNISTRNLLNKNCKIRQNWIHTAVIKNIGQVFFVKKEGPFIEKLIKNKKELKCVDEGVLNSAVAIIGAIAVSMIVDFFTKERIEEKMVRINLNTFEILKIKI